MPAKLIGAVCPLPGVGLRVPGHKYAVKLVITLIGPPGAGGVGEDIDPRIRTRWYRCRCACLCGRIRRWRASYR
jgi:hypothetical protein